MIRQEDINNALILTINRDASVEEVPHVQTALDTLKFSVGAVQEVVNRPLVLHNVRSLQRKLDPGQPRTQLLVI